MKVLEAIRVLDRNGRFAPKVLDADGAEIRVGDTVWHVHDLDKFTVTNSNNGENLSVSCMGEDGKEYCCYPNGLTHRAPVLAADGEPLRVGETVWDVYGQGPLVVRALPSEGEQLAVLDNGGTDFYRYPEKLTHQPPDSWERLEADAKAAVCVYFGVSDKDCGSCGHSSWECSYDKARDLVRRAKALAGVSE